MFVRMSLVAIIAKSVWSKFIIQDEILTENEIMIAIE